MRLDMKQQLKEITMHIPLYIYMSIIKRDTLGLYYHLISDEPQQHIKYLYPYKSTRMFENDLVYLAKNFNLISYEQLAEHYSGSRRLKPRSMILTFDDGLSQCYSVVRPLLLKYGIPCVFFIPTGFIDNQKMLADHQASLCIDQVHTVDNSRFSDLARATKDTFGKEFDSRLELDHWIISLAFQNHTLLDSLCQLMEIDIQQYLATRHPYLLTSEIKRLDEDGFTIGAHSVNHQKFDLLTEQQVEFDMSTSCQTIMSLTGKNCIPFSFPFSGDGVSRDMLREILKRHPYIGLLFDTNGILPSPNFVLSRMCGDWPDHAGDEKSNLPQRIKKAYREDLATRIRGSVSPILNRRSARTFITHE